MSTSLFDCSGNSLIFIFSEAGREGCIVDPTSGLSIMELPRQGIEIEGYPLHEDSQLSKAFSCYLKYLAEHHILLQFDQPYLIELSESEGIESLYDEDDEFAVPYSVKTIRIPNAVDFLLYNDDSVGFSFLGNQLYSSISVDVIERDRSWT